MIGISDENEFKIKRFLDQQDLRMAIYQDYKDFNVGKFDVSYRPYSVLLNAHGRMIWDGSPSELSVEKLRRLAERESYRSYKLEDIFDNRGGHSVSQEFSRIDTSAVFTETIQDKACENFLVESDSRVYFEGDLIYLYSKLLELPVSNLAISQEHKLRFSARSKIWDRDKDRIMAYLNNQFGLEIKRMLQSVESQELNVVDAALLWDTNQIDWGENQINNYIVGEQRLKADNLTIDEICKLLSELKNKVFVYEGSDSNKYDWNFHYKYENLMQEELLYHFGIEIASGRLRDIEMIEIKNSNP